LEEDWRYAELLAAARILVARRAAGAGARSEPDLRPLLQFLTRQRLLAAEGGWNERVIELSVVEALTLQAMGETAPALAALKRALVTAEPEGYVRIFLDAGAPLARLLYRVTERGPAREYAGRLLAAMPNPPAIPTAGQAQDPAESLTERELEVLRLIAAGRSNQEIAVTLGITFGTAKVPTHRLYSKLGVHSRIQAVRQAQRLGVLPLE
jgi:LuxR family maltose regulon positive regulatory protein